MAQVNLPYVFTNQTTADANQVDQNFNAITAQVNGNLDETNIKPSIITQASLANEAVTPPKSDGIPYATDLFGTSGFVQSGLTVTKDGTNANQVNVTSGIVWTYQSTSSILRRFAPIATNFKTVSASATYYLDLNPDGTWSWATGHSTQANYITIATVTSDASSNVNVITDTRSIQKTALSGYAQVLSGGYKVQSGSSSATVVTAGTSVQVTVTLPTAFASGTFPICAVVATSANNDAGYINVRVVGTTNSALTFQVNSYVAQQVGFNWIAIGQ